MVEADLRETDLREADLSDANLVGAFLNQADMRESEMAGATLNGANLIGADLRKADLRRANLVGTDLSGANLEDAQFSGANLSDSVLRSCVLANADLSGAVLNGASLDDSTFSGWNIQGVTCTHILKGAQREEVVRFGPGEFEKMYTSFEHLSEMILNIPLTAETAQAAVFIAGAVNKTSGRKVLELKEVTSISHKDTKCIFVILDFGFHTEKRKIFEIELRRALDEYFRKVSCVHCTETAITESIHRGDEGDGNFNETERGSKTVERLTRIEEDMFRIVESVFHQGTKLTPPVVQLPTS
jgi:uncharacterized protein YjbI with pentapeptide repeats